jgi:hypothetical protein
MNGRKDAYYLGGQTEICQQAARRAQGHLFLNPLEKSADYKDKSALIRGLFSLCRTHVM